MVNSSKATKFTSEFAHLAIVLIWASKSDSDSELSRKEGVLSCIYGIEYESQLHNELMRSIKRIQKQLNLICFKIISVNVTGPFVWATRISKL